MQHSVLIKVLAAGRGATMRVQVDGRGQAELHVPEDGTNGNQHAGFVGFATHNNLGVGAKCTFSELIVYSPPLSAPRSGPGVVKRP